MIEFTNVYPSVTIAIDALDEVLESDRLELVDALTTVLKESETLLKSSYLVEITLISPCGSRELQIFALVPKKILKTLTTSCAVPLFHNIPEVLLSTSVLIFFRHTKLKAAKLLHGKLLPTSSLFNKISTTPD